MTSIASSSVRIQTSASSAPSPPSWFGEVALLSQYLRQQRVLAAISEQVHFARRRFGHFEVIDFVAVLFGYALSGERTLEAFYKRLRPWASAFMALFARDRLPSRSALSRYLSALTPEPVEALRTRFLEDLLSRQLCHEEQISGLWDRAGTQWLVFDGDGTREAARQRALPQTADRPAAQRRLRPLCAPGYTGRKRGEVVRTRTTVLQTHTHQWLGTFGNAGNGDYRAELRRAVAAIGTYLKAHQFPPEHAVVRLDGQYGTAAVLAELAGLCYVMRGQDYHLLDRDEVQTRLHLPPDQQIRHPESGICRALYDCPLVPLGAAGKPCRIIVATHPAGEKPSRVGSTREGVVYELFLTALPQSAFTAADVVALYLQRGAFESTLSDEDQEQDPDRWCSHSAAGQECWQIICQWVWNLRLELGHHLAPEPARTTEFAPALTTPPAEATPAREPAQGYAPAVPGQSWKHGHFSGRDFALQPDGTLRCPAGQALSPTEHRREADGSLRVVYAAKIRDCRPCRLREQCQWHARNTRKPRRVSVLLHPLAFTSTPLLWRDWSRRIQRRACLELVRGQRVEIRMEPGRALSPPVAALPLSREQRAHWRLSWTERLARNARATRAGPVMITLFGVPDAFARFLGLATTYRGGI
jgi:hypothetical protein